MDITYTFFLMVSKMGKELGLNPKEASINPIIPADREVENEEDISHWAGLVFIYDPEESEDYLRGVAGDATFDPSPYLGGNGDLLNLLAEHATLYGPPDGESLLGQFESQVSDWMLSQLRVLSQDAQSLGLTVSVIPKDRVYSSAKTGQNLMFITDNQCENWILLDVEKSEGKNEIVH